MLSSILAAAIMATCAIAAPTSPNVNSLAERGGKSILEISYCNDCTTIGEGPASCTQTQYIHWRSETNGSHGGCNDKATASSDSCTASGSIKTPFGDGTFTADPGCDTNADNGTHQGSIIDLRSGGGGGVFKYDCVKAYTQYSTFCGFDYACNVYLRCTQT